MAQPSQRPPQGSRPGSGDGTAPRPPQVTYAGWAIILGSLALVVGAFQQIATLHTLDTRTAVERLITNEPSGLGITVDGWLTVLKVIGMVCGACAAAGAILGWQTLQRSRPARLVLLVLAVPLVVTGLATGPFFAVLVAIAVVVLWLPTANTWFDPQGRGRTQAMSEAPPPPGQEPPGQEPPPYGPSYGQPSGTPPQYGGAPGYPGAGASNPYAQQPYAAPQHPYQPPAPYGAPVDPDARPGAVTAAAIITIVLAGLSAILGLIIAVVGAHSAQDMLDELHDRGYDTSDFTTGELQTFFLILGVVFAIVSIAAIVAAILVLRRSRSARIVLTVLASLTIALSVVAITSVVSLITLVGAIVTIVLLYRQRSNAWFAGRSQPPYYPPTPPQYPGGGWPAG